MKQKVWAKTLLTIYNCLETIASAIDNLVITQSVSSGRNNLTTLENVEKVINLIQRKKLLVNLKVLIDNSLSKLDKNCARILIMKYVDKVRPEFAMEILELSRRTYFRRIDSSIDSFASALSSLGYDEGVLEAMLKKEHWIREYYNTFLKQSHSNLDEQGIEISDSILEPVSMKKCRAF